MNILVLGWEYPPFHSGGLGVASKNLSEALGREGLRINFALPSFVYRQVKDNSGQTSYNLVSNIDNFIEIKRIPTLINSPYVTEDSYEALMHFDDGHSSSKKIYGRDLFMEIERYAAEMEKYVEDKHFSIIHAHDWITFAAGCRIKEKKGIPMIAHVHATEYDRTGGNPNPEVYKREKEGMEKAEKVIAVSNYTKNIIKKHYGIPDEKIAVVYNGIEDTYVKRNKKTTNDERKKVLFLGRLSLQKGPDWFIKIAKRVLEKRQDIDFLIAGDGDMMPKLVKETIDSNLKDHVHFLGFLKDAERDKAFENSDVYVMSSVSEPFGLSATEAAQRGIPVALTEQSGAKEVLYHSLSADFWDVDKMANNILGILEYPALSGMLSTKGTQHIAHLTWEKQARKVKDIYHEVALKN